MHGGWQCYYISLIELTAEKCNEFLGMYNVHFLGMIYIGIVCVCVISCKKKNPECFFISFKLYLIVLLQISFFFPVVFPTPPDCCGDE